MVDSTSKWHRVWGSGGSGDGQFNNPRGIALGVIGGKTRLYVVDNGNHRVQVFTEYGEFIGKWGKQGNGEGEFWHPISITVHDGTHERKILPRLMSLPPLDSFPPGILSICVEYIVTERVCVMDMLNQRVQFFDPEGKFLSQWPILLPSDSTLPAHDQRASFGCAF